MMFNGFLVDGYNRISYELVQGTVQYLVLPVGRKDDELRTNWFIDRVYFFKPNTKKLCNKYTDIVCFPKRVNHVFPLGISAINATPDNTDKIYIPDPVYRT